jgi:hypothetical protein
MRPPARRGHRGLRPGGKMEWGSGNAECGMRKENGIGFFKPNEIRL